MCLDWFSSAPEDNSAEIARQQEAARQARIDSGLTQIEDVFSKFDDGYYGGVSQSYLDFYNPQLEDQYDDARRGLTLSLARTGNLNSSSGARKIGELTELFNKNQAQIGNQAVDVGHQARGSVESSRDELTNQLYASANPESAVDSALSRADFLSRPQVYSPLADAFGSFVDTVATGMLAEKQGYRGFNSGLFNLPKGGSAKVIS